MELLYQQIGKFAKEGCRDSLHWLSVVCVGASATATAFSEVDRGVIMRENAWYQDGRCAQIFTRQGTETYSRKVRSLPQECNTAITINAWGA